MLTLLRKVRRSSDQRGQSLVEFTLILPFLMILLMGIFEIGRAWQRSQVLTDVAREAARVAAYANSDASMVESDIDAIIDSGLIAAGLDPALAVVSYPPSAPGAGYGMVKGGIGEEVAVRIEYPHPIRVLDAFMGIFAGNDPDPSPGPTLILKTQVSFRNE